jgi:hypothetical protein
MKVYNLCCERDHRFEGWFSSEDDFTSQSARLQIECPVCNSCSVKRLPSAPRLNLSGAQSPQNNQRQTAHEQWISVARDVIAHTVDVGDRFAEEARRIHYREAPERGIRGSATPDEALALAEEGIDVLQIALPAALKAALH